MSGGPVGEEDAVELLLEAARERASTGRGQRRGRHGKGRRGKEEDSGKERGRGVDGIME